MPGRPPLCSRKVHWLVSVHMVSGEPQSDCGASGMGAGAVKLSLETLCTVGALKHVNIWYFLKAKINRIKSTRTNLSAGRSRLWPRPPGPASLMQAPDHHLIKSISLELTKGTRCERLGVSWLVRP